MARSFRFSLRSLLLTVLACGSGVALWMQWQPWESRILQTYRTSFSPDGALLVVMDDSGPRSYATIFNTRTGAEVQRIDATWDGVPAEYASIFPGNAFVLLSRMNSASPVVDDDGKLIRSVHSAQLFRLDTGEPIFPQSPGIRAVDCSKDGKRWLVQIQESDGTLAENAEIWESETRTKLGEVPGGDLGSSSVFSPNHSRFFFINTLYDTATGKPLNKIEVTNSAPRVVFSRNSRWCAVSVVNGGFLAPPSRLNVFDAVSGELLINDEIERIHENGGVETRDPFTPDESGVLIKNRIFDLDKRQWRELTITGRPVLPQAISPDGAYIAAVDGKGICRVFELASGKSIFESRFGGWEAEWSSEGALLMRDWFWRKETGQVWLEGCNPEESEDHKTQFLGKQPPRIFRNGILYDSVSGKRIWDFGVKSIGYLRATDAGTAVCIRLPENSQILFASYNRSEQWWGFVVLPSFWAVLIFVPLMLWSWTRGR